MLYPCPQCGHDTREDDFDQGTCVDCSEANHAAILRWEFAYKRWSRLTDREREQEIKAAIRRSS